MAALRFFTASATFALVLLGCATPLMAQISAQPTTNLPTDMPTEASRPVSISGQVALDDGTPLAEPVELQRVCGNVVKGEVTTDSKGRFTILLENNTLTTFQSASEGGGASEMGAQLGSRTSQTTRTQLWGCEIRALLPGYVAGSVSLAGRDFSMPVSVGTIVMRRINSGGIGTSVSATALQAPEQARKEFDKARDAYAKKKFEDADKHLAKAVELYPQYANALDLRGRVQRAQKSDADAEKSFLSAIAADDKYVLPYIHLAQLQAIHGKWEEVVRLSNKAVELDPVSFPDPYYFSTVAYLKLNNAKEARRAVARVLELDKEHRFPRAELIMGNMLRFEGNIPGSTEHYRKYVALNPPDPELPAIKAYLADMEKPKPSPAKPN
jgi:Tfp pilus assembly protein PilF